jgi:hypothetical protein
VSFLESNEMKTGRKADNPVASRVAKIEGKKLHFLTAGQGPALILLHGYTQTLTSQMKVESSNQRQRKRALGF